jgi:hypothetical protein
VVIPRTKYTRDTIPAMPERDDGEAWSDRCHRAWCAWWLDAASSQWQEGDITLLELALHLYDRAILNTQAAVEFRQLADRLGLSSKGKKDHRWRVEDEPEDHASAPTPTTPAGVTQMTDYRKIMGVE